MSERQSLPAAFWGIILATFVARTGFFVESFLTIFMKTEAGFSAGLAASVMALYGFGGAIAAFLSGPLVDRFGPRRLMIVSLLATAALAGVLALDPPNWSLFALVLMIGVVGQVIMPATHSYVALTVPQSLQRGAYSWVFIALNSGLAFGALIGGLLAGVSFSLMFASGAMLLVLGALFASVSRRRIRVSTAALAAASGSPATAEGEAKETADRARPMEGLRVLSGDRVFRRYILLNWLFMALYLQVFLVLPLLMLADGLAPRDYGIVMAANGSALVLLQLPVDRLLGRFSSARLFTVAALLLALGLVLNAFASAIWPYLVAAVFWTAAELINMPLAASVTAALGPPRLRGSYLAVHGMAFPLGMGLASLVGGSALALLPDPKLIWLVLAAVAGVLALLRARIEPGLRARLADAANASGDRMLSTEH